MRQHATLKIPVYFLLLLLFLFAGTGSISYAANDDPGAGRLSGNYVPDEFYDSTGSATDSAKSKSAFMEESPLNRLGATTSVSPYTGKTYTHQSTFDGRAIINGIDVSQWQGQIDWNKVKADGIDFAIIRVGYRGYGSSGTLSASTKDTYFDTNMKGAIAAGLKVGVYIFSQAITPAEAKEEAEYILNYVKGYDITMPLVLDYEYASTSTGIGGRLYNAKLSKAAATEICTTFCDTITAAGYTPMVYANPSMLDGALIPSTISAKAHIWLANYTTSTLYGGDFDFWQYSDTGSVDGITGNVDMNFYYATDSEDFTNFGVSIETADIAAIPSFPYTGNYITPGTTVILDGKTLTRDMEYYVCYKNNTEIGTATAIITGKDGYCGTRTVSFNILPRTMGSVRTAKRLKNSIKFTWNPDSTVTGYQIYYSTSLNGAYSLLKTVTSNTTTSFTHKKLKAGQCYYYKIRGYKTVNGTSYYGNLSSAYGIYTRTGYTRNALPKSGAVLYNAASTTGSTIVATPAAGTVMPVSYYTLDTSGDGWYYVTCQTSAGTCKGFIPADNVTITKVGKVVNTQKVNVRKSHSITSQKLTTLKKSKKVTIYSSKKYGGFTWYKVSFKKSNKSYNGWIAAPYIKIQ